MSECTPAPDAHHVIARKDATPGLESFVDEVLTTSVGPRSQQ